MIKILAILFFLLVSTSTIAQINKDSDLYKTLKARDSLLFELGFNQCKIDKFEHFISKDLEFYHDQGGLTTNKEDFLANVKNNIC